MKLYGYFRSSAAYRVRIAMNLKGLSYDHTSIHLRKGDQRSPTYLQVNRQGLVPALIVDDAVLVQSMAICEYLEEKHPTPALLPKDPLGRARVRGMAQAIACEIHPVNNLRVLSYLGDAMGQDEAGRDRWYKHWIAEGFEGLEAMLRGPATGKFCHGEAPTLADCFLVPQVANARRFNCDLSAFPTIQRIDAACNTLKAFQDAAPQNQPDSE
jgi:maleylpyruvate isomerase